MPEKTKYDLALYRIEKAKECLREASICLEIHSYSLSANRSYYCIFHAMRAVLALDGFDSKKHSGIIAAFRQSYIKTEIFPADFSDIVGDAFMLRGKSDYADFFIVSRDEVKMQFGNAKIFLDAIISYIDSIK